MARFTISKSKVLEQYRIVEELADVVSYSSKTNPTVTPILEENTDCFFSIHLKNELKNIKDFSRVLFLAQGWKKEDILLLIENNITNFVVDNELDIDTLISTIKGTDVNISLQLRVKLKENSIRTERYFVFGMNSDIVNKRIIELKGNPNIGSLGVHFHRKTQNMSEWDLTYEIENMLGEEVLKIIDVINIGGGLPSTYANTNVKVFNSIKERILELKRYLSDKGIRLMIEPGRFIAAPAGKLHSKIISIYDNTIIVDASVYNSDMDALIVPVKLLIEGELEKGRGRPFVIKGITPCSLDLFRYRVYLDNPRIGEELVFINAGAYNFTTDFCDLEKIPTEIVE